MLPLCLSLKDTSKTFTNTYQNPPCPNPEEPSPRTHNHCNEDQKFNMQLKFDNSVRKRIFGPMSEVTRKAWH